jgi:hypothetical protein
LLPSERVGRGIAILLLWRWLLASVRFEDVNDVVDAIAKLIGMHFAGLNLLSK